MEESLILEIDDAVAILTINDAPYNRMSLSFMDALEEMVTKIEKDDSIRAVVLTANGLDNFSVGMNLKQFSEGVEKKGSSDALFDQRLKVIAAIETMQKPWIVTMFGYCLGGGLEVPLGCHFRFAADEGAQIGIPELDLGAVPAWGESARLAKCVGENQAMDMILRSKKISGKKTTWGKGEGKKFNNRNFKKIKLAPLDEKSFSKVFNDSFWIVGQGTIIINALDKEYNFGSQISKEDGLKIIKVFNSKINQIKSVS